MMQDEELIRLYVTRSERAIALTSDKYGIKITLLCILYFLKCHL